MSFAWEKLFPDISILHRVRRSTTNDQTQTRNNPAASGVSIDGPVPPANLISSTSSNSNALTVTKSEWRAVSDTAQGILPGVAAVVGAIPLAGAPLQAAIGGLLFVLQGIDRNLQNKQDIASLKLRLEQLRSCLDNAPATTDPGEQYRRSILTDVLEGTRSKLADMNKRSFRYTARATQVIVGCSNDINNYLLLYSVSSQMQVGVIVLATLQNNQLPGTCILRCVTLVDAVGDEHPIQMEFCHSFEQLTTILEVILKLNSDRTQIQRRFLEAGQYNLSIDRNTEVTQLTSEYWPSIEAGTKIVMSIVVKKPQEKTERYQCYSCKTWSTISSASEDQTCLVDCQGCGRRFQVSQDDKRGKEKQRRKIKHEEWSPVEITERDIQLIRNWYLETELPLPFEFLDELKRDLERVRREVPKDEDWKELDLLLEYFHNINLAHDDDDKDENSDDEDVEEDNFDEDIDDEDIDDEDADNDGNGNGDDNAYI